MQNNYLKCLISVPFSSLFLALYNNFLLLNINDEPATKSIIRLSAPEAETIVDYFSATMYGGQDSSYPMNGNMIEAPMIPGATGISPSPTMIQQQHDLYGNTNMIASLRTHSSKFPVSIQSDFTFKLAGFPGDVLEVSKSLMLSIYDGNARFVAVSNEPLKCHPQ